MTGAGLLGWVWGGAREVGGDWVGGAGGLVAVLLQVLAGGVGEDADVAEPGVGQVGPVLFGHTYGVDAEAVASGGVHVEFRRDACGG